MPIRAVVFDLDNTLILEDASTFDALRAAATRAGGRADAAALAGAAAAAAEERWRAAPEHALGDRFGIWWGEVLWGSFAHESEASRVMRVFAPGFRRQVWRTALARVGVADDALADELEAAYVAARRSHETIDPEAEPLLAALARSYRLALLTNGASDVQREKLSRTPFERLVAAVVISGEVGVGKPDPRIFQIAAQRLGVDPDDAVMVGDSLARDVAGARAAGMRAVWLDRKLWDEPPAAPDARIERLSDLPAALDALARPPASLRGSA